MKDDIGLWADGPLIMRFDIKTVSEANQREHWAKKLKRKKSQQETFSWMWHVLKTCGKAKVQLPAVVTFTRFSCKELDSDNLAGSFKHVRDQLAKEIGIDDGSDQIRFEYKQERIAKREHYFTVEIGTYTGRKRLKK